MKTLNKFELRDVAGGNNKNAHVEVTAQNVQYLHVTVDFYQQPQPPAPVINHYNNINISNYR
ncbi:MAG: hypothetical protein BGO43_04130 [Gammaproteobacteria bacterium 39-13]|nr:hypothetical protein [Gammaproteobacteria bacterium]OJV94878.1 MAG: hypothetical protein BGO43_04130 [Gammaproteobacteria bacterium 39-13]